METMFALTDKLHLKINKSAEQKIFKKKKQ